MICILKPSKSLKDFWNIEDNSKTSPRIISLVEDELQTIQTELQEEEEKHEDKKETEPVEEHKQVTQEEED